jgi:hypothetical protein
MFMVHFVNKVANDLLGITNDHIFKLKEAWSSFQKIHLSKNNMNKLSGTVVLEAGVKVYIWTIFHLLSSQQFRVASPFWWKWVLFKGGTWSTLDAYLQDTKASYISICIHIFGYSAWPVNESKERW